jgi:tRNA threonylcarbamoyladenosine biosynthesis protein TsaB
MKNVIIYIDTSNNKEVSVSLKIGEKVFEKKQAPDHRKAQLVLPFVDGLLKEHQLQLSDITSIEVNQGPGSFTGLRVGITIANTLGFLLHIPVNGKKDGEQVEAYYQ